MAINDRFFEYIIDSTWSHYGAVQDVYILAPSNFDKGGQIHADYLSKHGTGQNEGYFTSGDVASVYTQLLTMNSDTKVTIGGASTGRFGNTSPQLLYSAHNTQKAAYAIGFLSGAGNGTIDFANTTGAGLKDSSYIQPIEPIEIKVSNSANIAYLNATSGYCAMTHNVDAHALKAIGHLDVEGDMNANITTEVEGTVLSSYYVVSNDSITVTNIGSNNTVTTAAYRTKSLTLQKDFTGTLKSTTADTKIRPRDNATAANNTIGAYGFWTDDTMQINGLWSTTGIINAVTNDVSIGAVLDYEYGDQEGQNEALGWKLGDTGPTMENAVNVSTTGNKVVSYGIQAGTIILGDVGEWAFSNGRYTWIDGGTINTNVQNVNIFATSYGKDNVATINNNEINSIAITGTTLTINGYFEGHLNSSISDIAMTYLSSKEVSWDNNNINLMGIRLSGDLTAMQNFGGTITLTLENSNPPENPNNTPGVHTSSGVVPWFTSATALYTANIYGIKAETFSVNDGSGIITTDISLSVSGLDFLRRTDNPMVGIYVNTLEANAFSGSISVQGSPSNDLDMLSVGVYAVNGMTNNNDGVVDITGNITVSGSRVNVGIMGGSDGFNFRVSGSIIAEDSTTNLATFAIYGGTIHLEPGSVTTQFSNRNDRVEVAAGAYIRGNINLGNGQDHLSIDSNAKIVGDLTAFGTTGTLNLEYVLNANPFDSSMLNSGSPIITALTAAPLASTCEVTVNLNSASSGEYILYEGQSNDMADWTTRTINFLYQGINSNTAEKYNMTAEVHQVPGTNSESFCSITEKGVTGKIAANGGYCIIKGEGGTYLEIVSSIVNNQVVFEVKELAPENIVQESIQIANLTNFATMRDMNKRTVTMSWEDNDGKTVEIYDLEYRINTVNADGSITEGKTIVQKINGKIGTSSLTLENIENNQVVEWRVRQSLGGTDTVGNWSAIQSTSDGEIVNYEVVLDKVSNATFELGKAAQSASSLLKWEVPESSEGIKLYRVRYFQTLTHYSDTSKIDWNNVAHITKEVTANELLITGLNNTEYFYWQVEAVDQAGNSSGWQDGELFKVYVDDLTPPTFTSPIESDTQWHYAADDTNPDKILLPTLTWNYATDDRAGVSQYIITYWQVDENNNKIESTKQEAIVYHTANHEYVWNDPTLSSPLVLENANYYWEITAIDYVGQISTPKAEEQSGYWYGDFIAPVFNADRVSFVTIWNNGSITVSTPKDWEAATDEASGIVRYELKYREVGSEDWKTVTLKRDQLNWTGNISNVDHEYRLSAFDAAGNESSAATGIWKADTVGPTFQENKFEATNFYNAATKKTQISFDWSQAYDESTDRPNSGVSHYVLTYQLVTDDENIKPVSVTIENPKQLEYTIPNTIRLQDGTYNWTITAYDNAGNQTTVSGNQFIVDTLPPEGSFGQLTASYDGTYTWTNSGEETTGRVPGFGSGAVTYPSDDQDVIETVESVWAEFNFPGDFTDASSTVRYKVQVSDSQNFTSRVTEFVTSSNTLRLDGTNGLGAGAISGMQQVYWRVMAMDDLGNATGIWVEGDPFDFKIVASGNTVKDTDYPTDIESVSVTEVTGSEVSLAWSSSSDVFGVKYYQVKYTPKGGKSITVDVDAVNAATVLSIAQEGYYTWSVRAVDYVGHTSAWTSGESFIIDVTAPTFNTKSVAVTTTPGSKNVCLAWTAATDAFLAGYQIEITTQDGNRQTINVGADDTSAWFYELSDGTYFYRVRAYDSNGNNSEWSDGNKYFVVDSANDPGSDFNTAKMLDWNTAQSHTVGVSDVSDFFTGTFSGAATLSITVSGVSNLDGKNSGVKLNLYNSAGKKLKSYTIKPGSTTLPDLLWDVNQNGKDYYIEVISSNKNTTAKYTIETNQALFPAASSNNSFATAEKISLDAAGTGTSAEDRWVGFGDAADYYKFTTSGNGALTIDLNMQPQSTKTQYKVSLYNADGKKLKNVTVKGELGSVENIFKNDILAETGTYYLVVESGDNGKGQQNGYYDFVVNDSYFPAASSNNDFKSAELVSLDAKGTGTSAENRWVGFGDATDYYKFTTDGNGAITIDFNMQPQSAKTQYKVTLYDATGKKLKNVTVKGELGSVENIFKNEILALEGTYFLTVESGDKGKGQQNGYYDFVINDDYFPAASSNNSFGTAEQIALNAAGTGTSDKNQWVGFGDAADYFKFTTTENGALSIDFNMQPQNAKTQYKVSLYDSAGKKLKNVTIKGELGSVENIFKNDVLAVAGTYYLVVESGDKGKGQQNGYYDFTINNDYFLDPQEVNDGKSYTVSSSINTSISGWVGFGDASDSYTIDAAAGSYSISINDVTAQLKVTLTDIASGKKIKTWNVKEDQMLISPALGNSLLKGDTLLTIESGDKGKGKQNSDYSISIVANEIFPAPTTNNDLASATSVNFGNVNTVDLENEWIGYGDDTDFFRFELDSASRVDFDLDLDNKALTVGKEVKVKLYNAATGKTLGLDGALTSTNTLEAGTYAVSVEISNPDKNWTSYDLGITKLA